MWDANNGWSIRFYNQYGRGYARAWVYQIRENLYTVMNGYGLNVMLIARIMAHHFGLTYKQIHLENRVSSALWINGHTGYLVGTIEDMAKVHSYDFGMHGDHMSTCFDCGKMIDRDDGYTGADDHTYCYDCFHNTFVYCSSCGNAHYQDDVHYLESTGEDVCEWCLERHYSQCDECGDYFRPRDTVEIRDSRYCKECAQNIPHDDDNEDDESEGIE